MPPGQARMVDTWADDSGCWADVYDDDHEEMQACEAPPDSKSARQGFVRSMRPQVMGVR